MSLSRQHLADIQDHLTETFDRLQRVWDCLFDHGAATDLEVDLEVASERIANILQILSDE